MSRTIVCGDIHGNYLALIQCLEKSKFDYQNDTLISLGDIADGWFQVPECVEELLKIKNLIPIRGNHDVWCWNWFTLGQIPLMWSQQGGQATIDAYISTGKLVQQVHKNFWNNQIDWYLDKDNRLFVHGGFDMSYGFEFSKTDKVNIPNATILHWDRSLADLTEKSWEKTTGKKAKANVLKFKEIYIGHTAHTGNTSEFNECQNIWNMDSGAGWYGKLTFMDIDTKQMWQSDLCGVLYPGLRGR